MSSEGDNLSDEDIVETKNGGEILGKYQIIKYIEKGSFGDVHLAKNMETGEHVAIKIVDKRKAIGAGSKRKKVVMDELNILKVKHPAIIELKDFFVTKDYLVLVMEYCAGGDLFTLATQENPVPEDRARRIFCQILEGIQHLHKLNIIHRDIKLENILLKEKGKHCDDVKITDFGMSRIISRVNLATTQCGTMEYTAPEVFKFQPYGRECDYWSLGILLYDLLSTELPFNSVEEIVGCEHKPLLFDSPRWDEISEPAKELVRNLLVYNPDTRWTIEQALQCAWIKQLDAESATVDAVPDTTVDPSSHTTTSATSSPPPSKTNNNSSNNSSNNNSNNNSSNNNSSNNNKNNNNNAPHTPTKKRTPEIPSSSPSFGMSLRKRIKVKQPYDV